MRRFCRQCDSDQVFLCLFHLCGKEVAASCGRMLRPRLPGALCPGQSRCVGMHCFMLSFRPKLLSHSYFSHTLAVCIFCFPVVQFPFCCVQVREDTGRAAPSAKPVADAEAMRWRTLHYRCAQNCFQGQHSLPCSRPVALVKRKCWRPVWSAVRKPRDSQRLLHSWCCLHMLTDGRTIGLTRLLSQLHLSFTYSAVVCCRPMKDTRNTHHVLPFTAFSRCEAYMDNPRYAMTTDPEQILGAVRGSA